MSQTFDFLQNLRGTGPWLLTAIHPIEKDKRGDTLIRSREVTSKETLDDFLSDHDGWNIYYGLNPTLTRLTKKASREDIATVEYLHVDIDPRPGEDIASEHKRIEKLLKNLPTGIPEPTAVIFSGGGYNILWKLEEPLLVRGELERAEEVKLYNLRLESILGGDHCHNIDRILRLPGTMNIPNSKKAKRGRVPVMSKVVYFKPERAYPIERFQKAALYTGGGDAANLGMTQKVDIEISGNIERLTESDLEKLGLETWIETLILLGHIPDQPLKYGSRSEGLFAAVCALVRAKVPDEKIYAIITDPEFGISESVLDKGSGVERYALHQIRRAKEKAVNPLLMEANDEFAVIENLGGKVRVVRFVEHAISGQPRIQRFSFNDFRSMLMNKRVRIPPQTPDGAVQFVPLGDWWLEHPQRRQYQQLVFAPGMDVPNAMNLWRGFAVEAHPPAPGEKGQHEPFLEHVFQVVCRENEEHYDYLLNWMARAVQQPATPGHSVVVMKGGQGTGKGLVARTLGELFGSHFKHVSDITRITGQFNQHLQDTVLLFGDEVIRKHDKQHAAALKRLATEPTLDIRALYHDAEQVPNYLHILLASNEDDIVDVDVDDRRFFILEVGEKRSKAHYKRIFDALDQGGREHLLYFLQTRDISRFDVTKIPQTYALTEQKLRSLDPLHAWWFEKIERGYIFEDDDSWSREIPADTLRSDFREWVSDLRGTRSQGVTANELTKFVQKMTLGEGERKQVAREMVVVVQGEARRKKRPYVYTLPELSRCRSAWDTITKIPQVW